MVKILATLSLPGTKDTKVQQHYRHSAQSWARDTLQRPFAVLDSETTGLEEPHLVEVACLNERAEPLVDTLVYTQQPISPSALALHGIDQAQLARAPKARTVLQDLVGQLEGRPLLIYNAKFDLSAIMNSLGMEQWQGLNPFQDPGVLEAHLDFGLGPLHLVCLMRYYAFWKSDYGDRGFPRYHPLKGGHRAKQDALAALEVLKHMV